MPKVKIADLVDGDGVVRGRTFEDTEIIGPAMLVPVGTENRIAECEFPLTPDNLFLARTGDGAVVMIADCTFRNCRFALDVDVSHLQSIVDA